MNDGRFLEAVDLSKHFASASGVLQRLGVRKTPALPVVKAVDGVSLTLRAGERFGLLGQSGSGKTTLARMLLKLTEPTGGRVLFQGRALSTMSATELNHGLRRQARLVFQHPDAALNPAFTVARILDQALKAHTDLPPSARRTRAGDLLHEVGLPLTYLQKYPHALSAGEKRRVSISRALATDPALLVADEPASGLDGARRGQILDLLARLHEQRSMASLLIAHDIYTLRSLCTRMGVMYAGRLVEVGPMDTAAGETCRHPYTRALYQAALTLSRQAAPRTAQQAPPLPEAKTPAGAASEGCPYTASCSLWHSRGRPDRCLHERPPLEPVEAGRLVACHFAR